MINIFYIIKLFLYIYITIQFRKSYLHTIIIDIKKVDKQLTHAMHVKDRHVNDTFID